MYSFVSLIMMLSVFFAMTSSILSAQLPYKDCANGEIKSLRIDPCQSYPCGFKVGDKVNVTVEFTANQNTTDAKLSAVLRTGGIFNYQMEYLGIDPNACSSSSHDNKLPCPLIKGNTYKLTISQVVPYASRFNIFKFVTWKLIGKNGRNLICAELAVTRPNTSHRLFIPLIE